ncbi:hypothetical protein [Croceivirga sp. JEA036]|uniref:hypothetical protein n=1 Tax=Croceivirga sp. JEA036 TaxID=2721162 RepID=UPI001ADA7211|nr:hypothetical protein [Croceivirga sp. JEA036]
MKTIASIKLCVSFCFCFMMTSCGPLIFSANFNADNLGSAPNPNPPGEPSGDEIKGNCGITVVDNATIGSKSMRFYNEPNCSFKLMWFESDNVPSSNKFLNYSFLGTPESTNHKTFHISFSGGHFESAFDIKFKDGHLLLTDGAYNEHVIGTYTANEKQTFLVGINRETNEYALNIYKESGNINLQNRPVKSDTFWGKSAYLLYVYYDVDDTSNAAAGYVFDDVKINKEKE